jgi:hypothetical protein
MSSPQWRVRKSGRIQGGIIALSLALVGIGIVGMSHAQGKDSSGAKNPDGKTPPPAKSAPAAKDKKADTATEREMRQEMESLLQQRQQLNERIATLRKKLGDKDGIDLNEADGSQPFREFFRAFPNNGQLTPEQRQQIEESMRQAHKAMEEAFGNRKQIEESMQQAQKALKEAFGNRKMFVMPAMPAIPWEDLMNLEGLQGFFFQFDGKNWQGGEWPFTLRKPGDKLDPETERQLEKSRARIEALRKKFQDKTKERTGDTRKDDTDKSTPKAKDKGADTSKGKEGSEQDDSATSASKSTRINI